MGLCCSLEKDKRYAPGEMSGDMPLEMLREEINYNEYDLLQREFPPSKTHIDHYMNQINSIGSDKFTVH